MKEILKLTLSLTLICAIAGTALAFVSHKTAEPREAARIAQRDAKMKLLLPVETDRFFAMPTENGVTFYSACNNEGTLVAYCAEGSDPNGFGGEVKVLVGFNLDGTIRGVLVSENSETPGIGSHACNREKAKSLWSLFKAKQEEEENDDQYLPPNSYLDSFNNQHLGTTFYFGTPSDEEGSEGAVTPITGATVSSTAIRNAVNRISEEAARQFQFPPTSPKE